MKKTVTWILTLCLLIGACTISSSATGTAYNWYCPHVKDHLQPTTGGELLFSENYDAYYLNHTDEKVIYLTFDAGYENGNVARILDVLKENDATAAFFILGNLVTRNTDLVLRMVNEGHLVCNHTVRHKDMSTFDEEAFRNELKSLEDLFREKTGCELSKYYRPPEGRFSEENLSAAQKLGYKTVFWSFAYPDWDNRKQPNPEKAINTILSNAHAGEIMLLHPTSDTNAEILDTVLKSLKAEGYRFGSLEELGK